MRLLFYILLFGYSSCFSQQQMFLASDEETQPPDTLFGFKTLLIAADSNFSFSGTSITSWTNLGTSGNNASAPAGWEPDYISVHPRNGEEAVYFDGSDMRFDINIGFTPGSDNSYTIIAVANIESGVNLQTDEAGLDAYVCFLGTNGNHKAISGFGNNFIRMIEVRRFDNDTNDDVIDNLPSGESVFNPTMFVGQMNGNTATLYANNNSSATEGGQDGNGTNTSSYFVGFSSSSGVVRKWKGHIQFLAAHNEIVSGSALDEIMNYLTDKYGIPE